MDLTTSFTYLWLQFHPCRGVWMLGLPLTAWHIFLWLPTEHHFGSSGMTLHERFTKYLKRGSEQEAAKNKKSPEIHRWGPWLTLEVIIKDCSRRITQLCLTLCDLMDSTVLGILQARILEWVAFPFSRGSSQPRDWTRVSCIAGGFLTNWAQGSPKDCPPENKLVLFLPFVRCNSRI